MDRKALVVDDDENIRRLIQTSLEKQGFGVTQAANGAEALQRITDDKPDLVVMDVEMPVKNGLETLKALRENPATASLPVIMLSGKDQATDADRAYDAGANLYLEKPFKPGVLKHAIDSVLAEAEAEPITLSGC